MEGADVVTTPQMPNSERLKETFASNEQLELRIRISG